MKTTDELLQEIQETLGTIDQRPKGPPVPVVVEPPLRGERVDRRERRRERRASRLRFAGLLLLAFLLGGATMFAVRLVRSDAERRATVARVAAAGGAQRVVAWTVWEEQTGTAFSALLGAGGGRDPVLLGIPPYTIVSIPGRGLGTLGDAAHTGDAGLVATTLENVLRVHVDAALATPAADLGRLVDALGGIEVGTQRMDGAAAVAYLTGGRGETGELRFLRFQEVTAGILAGLKGRPGALEGIVPNEVAPVFEALATSGTAMIELPLIDAGAGLARPDTDAIPSVVAESFSEAPGGAAGARLVVLNGNGLPGIGEQVARILVPAGFRLVSSQNAQTFDEAVTVIVAAREDFLDEAKLAQELLGVGRVALGRQPTRVADVTVIVGKDFGGA